MTSTNSEARSTDETKNFVAWAPEPDPEPNFPNPSPEARRYVGALLVPKGTVLKVSDEALMYLADRVQALVEAEDDPESAAEGLWSNLKAHGLAVGSLPKLENVGNDLIYSNPEVRERLSNMRVFENLPKGPLEKDDPEARKYLDHPLEQWEAMFLNGLERPR